MNAQTAKGLWTKNLSQEESTPQWKAHWIWANEEKDIDVILARKCFELGENRQDARLYLTASSIYRLYINGKYVARGPARSAPHHQYVDAWDIGEFLQQGKNCLAIRVHSQSNKHSYHDEGRAGLFAQLEIGDKTIISDKSWKVSADLSWDSKAPMISRFQQIVRDRVDFRNYAHGWQEIDFKDSDWENAHALMRNVGWPGPPKDAKPIPLTPPWNALLLRDLPYLVEQEEQAKQIIQAGIIDPVKLESGIELDRTIDQKLKKHLSAYQLGDSPLEIPPVSNGKSYFLLFDLGSLRMGTPQLEIEGTEGQEISILSAPFLVEEVFSHKVVFSNYEDKLVLSGKKDSWEATYFKPARFMGIYIPSSSASIKIHSFGIRSMDYPFKRKGHISSPDAPWVKAYMDATDKTIKACTTDGYTDNYRERRQYAQTGYYGAMGNYWLFGDHELQRRYLVQVAQEQDANGIMPAYAP
ncbi:MAG: alpha-L-rhamnosidase N-terminal domain-containing protein, partial [Bacteroidota bacterium]